MEITLMSGTRGTGNKLRDIKRMEYITPTLKTNILQNGTCLSKAQRDRKTKVYHDEGKSWKRS